MTETKERIGKKIAELRAERGLSQHQLSKETGIDRAYITRIEQGRINAGIDTVDKILQVLNAHLEIKKGKS